MTDFKHKANKSFQITDLIYCMNRKGNKWINFQNPFLSIGSSNCSTAENFFVVVVRK